MCVCVWVEYVAVGCVRELIGGGSCELARDGSSDAANRGGERDRRLPSRRATLYLKTGLKLSELLLSFFGGLSIITERGKKKKGKGGRAPTRILSAEIYPSLAPL